MRTIFVNPSRVRRRKRSKRRNASLSNPRRRRRRSHRRRNVGITPFVRGNPLIQNPRRRRRRNPMPRLGNTLRDTLGVMLGAVGGFALNRIGLQHIDNFYARNGARIASAATLMAFFGTGSRYQQMSAAAAGATLAPVFQEAELKLSSPTNNPQELAAELAGLLEADLSDELSDENLSDVLEDEITW